MSLLHKNNDHPVITGKKKLTLAQRAADAMTEYMGSWLFIILFLIFLFAWMAVNWYGWVNHWDPYPFILLNLVLSMISALQAPIIMMSQNRQAERDRVAAKYDYAVNRKVDREVQAIQEELVEIKAMIAGMAEGKKKRTRSSK